VLNARRLWSEYDPQRRHLSHTLVAFRYHVASLESFAKFGKRSSSIPSLSFISTVNGKASKTTRTTETSVEPFSRRIEPETGERMSLLTFALAKKAITKTTDNAATYLNRFRNHFTSMRKCEIAIPIEIESSIRTKPLKS